MIYDDHKNRGFVSKKFTHFLSQWTGTSYLLSRF